MIKNIFLTGAPSAGKTTVIRKVITKLSWPAKGFYTEEERKEGRRIGFLMKTLDGKQGYLARQGITSQFNIRRYGVSIENIETIAVPAIEPVKDTIIILDEIGKMECFSACFKKAALKALGSPNIVVGTLPFGGTDFILKIKARQDIEIIDVTEANRNELPNIVLGKITELKKFLTTQIMG